MIDPKLWTRVLISSVLILGRDRPARSCAWAATRAALTSAVQVATSAAWRLGPRPHHRRRRAAAELNSGQHGSDVVGGPDRAGKQPRRADAKALRLLPQRHDRLLRATQPAAPRTCPTPRSKATRSSVAAGRPQCLHQTPMSSLVGVCRRRTQSC